MTELQAAGLHRLHWDTTDGDFAVPGGFTPDMAAAISQATGTSSEAHLMAQQPLHVVDAWSEVCDTVVVHAESEGWQQAVNRLEQRGCRPGIALSPRTPVDVVPQGLAVLVMSIVPGQAGSTFDRAALAKVKQLRDQDSGRPIGLDGGLTRTQADTAIAVGATWLVVGTDLFSREGASRWADLLTTPSTP